jgi:hypothetical protein
LESFERLPLDTLKMLFSMLDINQTVCLVEARYINSGLGRPRYPVPCFWLCCSCVSRPSVRKLCRRLRRRSYARDICEFRHGTPDHTTF